jgi:hypothetical protein
MGVRPPVGGGDPGSFRLASEEREGALEDGDAVGEKLVAGLFGVLAGKVQVGVGDLVLAQVVRGQG